MATESSVMAVIRAARPSFRNAHDRVAFALHAAFLAAGFSLTATGPQALSDNPPVGGEEVGMEGWNQLEDAYGFVYTKTTERGEKKNVWVKCLVVGDALMVDALSLDDEQEEPLHLEINVKEFAADVGEETKNYAELFKNLKNLVEHLNVGILEKLEPKDDISSSVHISGRAEHSVNVPVVRVPVKRQSRHPGFGYPPIQPCGNSDLFPEPGTGFYPGRGPGIGGIGGGMLVGPNDPQFLGSVEPGSFGGLGGVPPGVRFDPIGPANVPGFEPGCFIRQPGGGTHPDLEHFQEPDII